MSSEAHGRQNPPEFPLKLSPKVPRMIIIRPKIKDRNIDPLCKKRFNRIHQISLYPNISPRVILFPFNQKTNNFPQRPQTFSLLRNRSEIASIKFLSSSPSRIIRVSQTLQEDP